ncbi:alpha/beta hydrolase fold-3 [Podospora appendiculata]|uniref:Alpha/beta hydrolase fold-3 n=1 Tax=Podospora appendiculata TaxID=314037 RepID=A0AAE0XFH4_9PEZI|nr:alpha/beta hydrolase fold-3 [Podospora appendiculata]
MDNSQYGHPSKEWLAYGAAHPELHIDDNALDEKIARDPATYRDTANAAKEEAVRALIAEEKLDEHVLVENYTVPTRDGATIPLRAYRPTTTNPYQPVPAYLYFHGGGMLFGSVDSEDYSCMVWARRLGFAVISVCYRHTPDFQFPTQTNDAWDAFEWVAANAADIGVDPDNIVVGGVSAGGCLTAGVVFREVALAKHEDRKPRVKGQLLVIPWLVHRDVYPTELFAGIEKCSIVQCADAAVLPKSWYDLFTDLLAVKDPKEPIMNVALAADEELRGTPRTAFIVCGWDMLRDEAFILADKLERLGVPTKKHVFPGLPHAFRKYPDLPSSKRWDDRTVESIQWLVNGSARADEPGNWQSEIFDP